MPDRLEDGENEGDDEDRAGRLIRLREALGGRSLGRLHDEDRAVRVVRDRLQRRLGLVKLPFSSEAAIAYSHRPAASSPPIKSAACR